MYGWSFWVNRQANGSAPATGDESITEEVAAWQVATRHGLFWINDLVRKKQAIDLNGNGYPYLYTAQAKSVFPFLLPKPPRAVDSWAHGPDDILSDKWHGKTFIDQDVVEKCSPDEWLVIKVWIED